MLGPVVGVARARAQGAGSAPLGLKNENDRRRGADHCGPKPGTALSMVVLHVAGVGSLPSLQLELLARRHRRSSKRSHLPPRGRKLARLSHSCARAGARILHVDGWRSLGTSSGRSGYLKPHDLIDDVGMTALELRRRAPHVDRSDRSGKPDSDGGRVRSGNFVPPVSLMSEHGQAAGVNMNRVRNEDIDLAEKRNHVHSCRRAINLRLTKVEVDSCEYGAHGSPSAKVELALTNDMPNERGGKPGGLAMSCGRWRNRREIHLQGFEIISHLRSVGHLDPIGELLK
jgi:hypothetical protein